MVTWPADELSVRDTGYAAYASETPFEHLVLEAILHNACHQLQERIKALVRQFKSHWHVAACYSITFPTKYGPFSLS